MAPKYVALLTKRYALDRSLGIIDAPAPQSMYPDVHVAKPPGSISSGLAASLTTAITAPAAELPNLELAPQLSVEIRDVANRRLVTLIEILSPANKYGDGSWDYEDRRLEILRTRTHVLEIDLLRGGKRIQLAGEQPSGDYFIYLSRIQRCPNTQVWAVALRQHLPVVPVPLLEPDPDVAMDLQAAVNACFALVGYERLLDYSGSPPPPRLEESDTRWMDEVLKAANRL